MAKGEKSMAAERGGKKGTVILRSEEDGKMFVLSEAEARCCGRTVHVKMKYDSESHRIPSDDSNGQVSCCLVRLSAQGDALSKVINFNTGGVHNIWDGRNFDLDPAAFFDLILAADYLRHEQLRYLTCKTVADKIHKMSPYEIRKLFNIRTDLNKNRHGVKPDLDQERVLTLSQNALKALHIVRCESFTAYDPKRRDYICTRFCSYNIAFFDLEKESILAPGPPLDKLDGQICVQSAVNVISLKVTESDVDKKLSIFGTVIARDQVDYRCLVLFKRGEADAQTISLPDGMLTLTSPCQVPVLLDEIILEMDLKIKHDGGDVEDFSRGMICLERARLPTDEQTMTRGLSSWLSRVELTCAHVVHPVEATIAISILKGPCNISRVAAWSVRNREDYIILYGGEGEDTHTVSGRTFGDREDCTSLYGGGGEDTHTVSGSGSCPVPLSRCLVAVPVGTKLVLYVVGVDMTEQMFVTAGQSDDQFVCKMGLGLGEVQ